MSNTAVEIKGPKPFNHNYKGYQLKIYNRAYHIYFPITETKWKCIRSIYGYAQTVNTHQGKKLAKGYENDSVALQKAKEYIDTFLSDPTHKYHIPKSYYL
jgi:hypothetical protein